MTTQVRTLNFLPEIFRTVSNQQFLDATLDQLVSQPKLDKIEGYIGRKFEYGLTASDSYIPEINKNRQNYQLEPGVVFTKTNTSVAVDFLTYSGLIDSLSAENGSVENHSKLFANQFYSWDSFVNLDKLVNFSQYYWLPEGPDSVDVTPDLLYNTLDYTIKRNSVDYSITANDKSLGKNPTIKLLRGGIYTFQVSQNSKFYIQTTPGISGIDNSRNNVSSREVFGVLDNGRNEGIITFNVPNINDQDEFIFPGNTLVDLVSTVPFNELHGKPLSAIKSIDNVNLLENKTLMFYGFDPAASASISNFYDDSSLDATKFDTYSTSIINNNIYKINFTASNSGDPIMMLSEFKQLPTNQKITATGGRQFIGKNFVRNELGEISLLPQITSKLDTLYYQDADNPLLVGTIQIIEDNNSVSINVETDILGKEQYTSPLGVVFSNGMKINFTGLIFPENYRNKKYYVEGVGNSIELVPESDLIIPEKFTENVYKYFDTDEFDTSPFSEKLNIPVNKDYITIDRNAQNRNPWSRSNRWFHIDVLKSTIKYSNGSIAQEALNNKANRANRPIIEFYPNLKLSYAGTVHKSFIDFFDTTVTSVGTQVSGNTSYYTDDNLPLFDGAKVVFSNDADEDIRKKIFTVRFQSFTLNGTPVITLNHSEKDIVLADEQVVTKRNTNNNTYYFTGSRWYQAQTKTTINQSPLFDVFDINGISFRDQDYYNGSDFAGSKLFSYAPGTGNNDTVLGFPIKYSSVSNIGDISFDVNFNVDTFNFIKNSVSTTYNITDGYVHNYTSRTKYTRKIGWETAKGESFQYQAFDINYLIGASNPSLVFNILPIDEKSTPWPVIKLFVDSVEQTPDQFSISTDPTKHQTYVLLKNPPTSNTLLQVLINSDDALDSNAYYTIPSNLSNNPFNVDIQELSLGDLRGQYQSICTNSRKVIGDTFGANNYRDRGNLNVYGTKIIRNSASLINTAVFLRNKEYNLIDALTFNEYEYVKYKQLILSIVDQSEYTPYMSGGMMLDDALQQISSYKQEIDSFFWSDMLPSRAPYISKDYTFNAFIDTSFFPLSRIYDFENANYYSVLVYLKEEVSGLIQTTQLIKDRDYIISKIEPKLQITKDLLPGQSITINEYNNTYGSYVPNTPTKLGLYPASEPEIIFDNSYLLPAYFIKGHDGSLAKLHGEYKNGYLTDFKDKVLLEFETRIYNNIKVSATIPIKEEDILPGYFRNTGNTQSEIQKIYSANFLDWIGRNNIDYSTQFYSTSEKFTWNYAGSLDMFNKPISQGFWRGIFMWYYDTTTPQSTPWEMLGITSKPLWWDAKYGEAPYTSDNKVLWDDIEKGYNYNNGDPVIITSRARPGLSSILPVDSYGNLKNPFNSIMRDYSDAIFNKDWIVGDLGPAEYSYRRSSNWPFDLMKIFALLKPAKFFALAQDLDLYAFSAEFNQFMYDGDLHKNKIPLLYGNGTAQHSYMNWVVDYVQNTGYVGYNKVSALLDNLDVRLIYKVAGFTDKEYLNFYLEKSSTNSSNTSLLLPSESFRVLLYENQPTNIIRYSSIIIQKTSAGYKVSGNSQTRSYFITFINASSGSYNSITINNLNVKIPNNYTKTITYVPYGTEFKSVQALCEFIVNYGRYLSDQGLLFENQENGFILNWNQMVAEVLYWISSGWEVGSIVNINPAANGLVIDKENLVVQPLTIHNQNYVLNQNLYTINISDLAINREGTRFEVKPLNDGDTIAYFTAQLSSLEHAIVFDNTSLFNDTLFNPVTGLRQNRLFLRGAKSAEWNGTMNAQGFILNQDNIENWTSNLKYTKGSIVFYQNNYWMANKVIQPSMTFNVNDWIETDYEQIQKGLLPNASARASESELYYDTRTANLKNDGDLLGFSLIGYRPRDFLTASDLSDISQVNLFKTIIPEKGTKNIIDAVQNIQLGSGPSTYEVYENWALKTAEYGGLSTHNFIEIILNKDVLTGNPNIVGIIKDTPEPNVMQTIPLAVNNGYFSNYGTPITSTNILPIKQLNYLELLPTAGYVNFKDIRMHSFTFDKLNNNVVKVDELNQGDYIWLADDLGTWKVITPIPMGNIKNVVRVVNVVNNLNGTCSIVFDNAHNLIKYDTFMIINYDSRVNGFYRVNSVTDTLIVVVDLTLASSVTAITNVGICARFQNQRVKTPKYISTLSFINDGASSQKVWLDESRNSNWSVVQKTITYQFIDTAKQGSTQYFGNSIAYDKDKGIFVGDPLAGMLYRYEPTNPTNNASSYIIKESISNPSGYGTAMARADDILAVTLPNILSSKIYIYALHRSSHRGMILHQTITIPNKRIGDVITMSGDKKWLFASSLSEYKVYVYKLSQDLTRSSAGFTTSGVTSVYAKQFIVNGDQTDALGHGDKVCFSPTPRSVTYAIEIATYNSVTNKTTFFLDSEIKTSVATGTTVYKATYTYTSVTTLNVADVLPAWSSSTSYIVGNLVYYNGETYIAVASGSNRNPSTQANYWKVSDTGFGKTIACNYDGSKIFVGAPTQDFTPTIYNMGKVYVYKRIIQNLQFYTDSLNWSDRVETLAWSPANGASVSRNGIDLTENFQYSISTNKIIFKYPFRVAAGDLITISSGDFVYVQELIPYDYNTSIRAGILFGNGLDTNKFGNEVLVGAPIDISTDNVEGAVYRFTHEGKNYGTITGTKPVTLSSPATVLINGTKINLPGTGIDGIVDAIMNNFEGSLNNIGALKLPNNRLQLYLAYSVIGRENEKLEITVFNKAVLDGLGFSEYVKTQTIRDVYETTDPCHFGYSIKFNDTFNSFAVSATTSSRFLATTFDFIDDGNSNNDTYFDNNFTRFVDFYTNAGAVYIYDYIPEIYENLDNIGSYVFAQSCNDLTTNSGKNTNYGKYLAFNDYALVIGIPDFADPEFPGTGRVTIYKNLLKESNWSIFRKPVEYVDIDKLTGVQLYDNITNERLVSLDYIDPQQGKLLGAVTTNLDYIGTFDPAGYNTDNRNNNLVWGSDYIGKTWFNTSTTKFASYHQEDIVYNSQYWGTVFPDSIVTVYSWIESDTTPVNYVGNGTPYSLESYSTTVVVDNTGSLVLKYYFWVRNTNIIFENKGKTLSDSVLELYIANPIISGIPFFVPFKSNVYGIYNASEFINGKTTSLYIGFNTGEKEDTGYNEYKLIRAGYQDDFISGLPSLYSENNKPEAMYEKLLDSFAGLDSQGKSIPDINLPKLMQTGISYRPRQSMFKNRLKALENYFGYANTVLKQYPIAEFKTPSLLGSSNAGSSTIRVPTLFTITGDNFDTTKYWEYIYWWEDGYSVNTKIDVEVAKYYGLATLTPFVGMIAGVTMNSEGKREVYTYNGTSWDRIGLEQGTIQIKDSLWDYENNKIGFDNNFFDLDSYDNFPSIETRYIVRALNEEVYTETLRIHRNKSLTLMFEYIVGENTSSQNNLTWLNKTSLVDVHHTLRELAQDKNYKRDNQTFLEGYINEVKPYHVIIKEFLIRYTSSDSYSGQVTDFDLPGRYNDFTGKFITPNLVFDTIRNNGEYLPISNIWDDNLYSDWYENYGLSLTGKTDHPISTLTVYLDEITDEIYVADAFGFPITGTIKINDEYISYATVDREKGKLINLTRGANDSEIAPHYPPTTVYIDLPGVVLLETGRDYIDPPTINAVVDTTIYPAPTKPALLEPVMSDGKVIDIVVIDPGAGYTTKPDIVIQPSEKVLFNSTDINFQENTIKISSVGLQTGDAVKYTRGPNTAGILGLQNKQYYYVRVLYADETFYKESVIALYTTKNNALIDNHRVNVAPSLSSIGNKLELSARAVSIISNTPTREMTTTLKFDRTSYKSKVEYWKSGTFYGSILTASGAESSVDVLLDYAIPYPGLMGTGDTKGAIFTVYNILLNYTYDVEITFEGLGYSVGNVLTIKGEYLGGTTPANNCTLTVTQISGVGGIQGVSVSGTPVTVTRVSQQEAVLPITNISTVDTTFAVAPLGKLIGDIFVAKGTLTNTFTKGMMLSGGTIPAYTVYITEEITSIFIADCPGGPYIDVIAGSFPLREMVITGNNIPANTTVKSVLGSTIELSNSVPYKTAIELVGKYYKINTSSASPKTDISITGTAGNAVATLEYERTNLSPGQLKGLQLYFYKIKPTVTYTDPRPGGATIKIHSPNFSVQKIENNYFIEIISPGSGYAIGDVITIDGFELHGTSGINDMKIKVIYVAAGAIVVHELSGVSASSFKKFYIKPITSTDVAIYYDAAMLRPVPLYDFGFTASDYGFIPEPIYITSGHTRSPFSLVSYNNTLYRCIVSNNDTEFNFDKWEEVQSGDPILNALDRIMGFYNPTENMPGKNLPMLVSGIDYPNNTYFGQSFDDITSSLDTVLKDQIFYPSDIDLKNVIFNDDGTFIALGETEDYSVILLSYDNGLTWTIKRISTNKLNVQDITRSEDHYIVVTKNKSSPIVISRDLNTWVSVGDFTPYDTLTYDESGFDSTSISAPRDQLNSVVYHNNYYFSVGDELISSSDGFAWSSTFNFYSSLPQEFRRIGHISSERFEGFLAVGNGTITDTTAGLVSLVTTSRVLRSVDGDSWEEILPRLTANSLNVVISSDTKIVLAGDNATILTSLNSHLWEEATINGSVITDNLLNGIYYNGTFVIVGENGTLLVSSDGDSWNKVVSNTTQHLTGVTFNGDHWVAVGDNATILRSLDALSWENVSLIKTEENFYSIKGDPFMSGYGPEELVPSVLTDTLTMTVITRPGSTWAVEDFGHTGFTVKSFTSSLTNLGIDFSKITFNPAQLSVFLMDATTDLSIKLYQNITPTSINQYSYTIDWINKLITLTAYDNNMLFDDTHYLFIEVYEFGNSNQEIRSNSQSIPMRIDPITNNTELWLGFVFDTDLSTDPVVYYNGEKLVFGDDYTIATTLSKETKLLFSRVYNPNTDYLSFAVLGKSGSLIERAVGHSVPETQVFEVGPSITTLTLNNFVGLPINGYTNDINAIVEYNGLRLIPSVDYTIAVDPNTEIGTVTLLVIPTRIDGSNASASFTTTIDGGNAYYDNSLINMDIDGGNASDVTSLVSVTTFNDTKDQYLLTEVVDTLQVTSLIYVSTEKGELLLIASSEPEFLAGDSVTVDGIIGTTQLNGNQYYARLLDPYTENTITYHPIKLFYDSLLSKPVTGKILSSYISGGYIWKTENTHQINQPALTLNNSDRLYVTVNGSRVDSSRLKISADNKLSILISINLGDTVIITSMIPGATPNQLIYCNTVDKNGEQIIYSANQNVRTWLTTNLESMDSIIYVQDVSRIIDLVSADVIASTINNSVACFVNYEFETIKEVKVTNISTLTEINSTDITLAIKNSRPIIYIRNGASDGDNLRVSLRIGDLINIDGEIIKYKKVNIQNNTISGITRGVNGSGLRRIHSKYTTVTAIKLTNTLFNYYYDRTWNSEEYTLDGDPLQISDSFPANFLQVGTE